jgi:multiple sugar transport system ATP-binding protein
MASLEIRNMAKQFGQTVVLDGIDIEIEDGEFLVLVGPSGCGKSTLLNIIAGLETATEGDILIGENVVNEVHPKDRDIAMVFQSYALYPNMTVRKNITFGMEVRKVPKQEISEALSRVSELLQIEALLDRKPAQLSGGQRQRVAMGRALVRDPSIFLFDEPLSNLDAKLRVEMRTEIKNLHHRLGTTIVYVTHDQTEAMNLATRIAVLDQGHVQQLGDPQTLYDTPDNVFVAGFIGSPAMNLISGKIVDNDGKLFFKFDNKFENELVAIDHYNFINKPAEGDDVIIGIRPESIKPPGDIQGEFVHEMKLTAESIETNGYDKHVVFEFDDSVIMGRFPATANPQIDMPIPVGFDLSNISIFDKKSEKRL